MDGLQVFDLILFNVGTFAAALVAGIAGFAFGIIAAAVWLHFLLPAQAASLIIAYGLIVQAVAVWKLRRSLQWRRLAPFLVGGACRLASNWCDGCPHPACAWRSARYW